LMPHREDRVEIFQRHQLASARRNPAVARPTLALGTVAVATGNGEISITCPGLNRCAVFAWHQHFNAKSPR
jgi:hypothetical protein